MVKEKPSLRAIDITYVAMFAALMSIGANLTSFIMIGSVPLTMQTFFAILAGVLLGSRLGSLSMLVYTLIGFAGAPVFAKFTGGFQVFMLPTLGFIFSFIILAYFTGKIVEKQKQPTFKTFAIACFVGLAINYLIGTNYLYVSTKYILEFEGITYRGTWRGMQLFLYKDIVVTFFAALISPKIYHAVRKTANSKTFTT